MGLQAKILEAKYEAKLEFPGGSGVQSKNLPWGENEYFLELHILDMFFTFKRINIFLVEHYQKVTFVLDFQIAIIGGNLSTKVLCKEFLRTYFQNYKNW